MLNVGGCFLQAIAPQRTAPAESQPYPQSASVASSGGGLVAASAKPAPSPVSPSIVCIPKLICTPDPRLSTRWPPRVKPLEEVTS